MKGLIDFAITSPVASFKNKGWIFKGSEYIRYDFQADRADAGFPQAAPDWGPGAQLSNGADAAVNGQLGFAGKSYFFIRDQYFRYDWNMLKFDQPAQPLTAWGLSGDFANGVDAVVNGEGAFAGKAYFFKNDQYVRYDWTKDKVDQAPKPISAWGLSGDFASGIDALVNGMGRSAGKVFFFKGDRYVRYSWAADTVETEPRLIAPNWPGLGELLLSIRGDYPALFNQFCIQGRIDDDVADLLNEMHNFPAGSWPRQSADFAFHELLNNNLVGIVRAENAERLRPFVDPANQNILDQVRNAGGNITDGGDTFALDQGGGVIRGMTLLNNTLMNNAAPGGSQRLFMQLALSHELTHFRNRVIAQTMDTDLLLDFERYSDPVMAANFANTRLTRSRFINELTCRHVAWRVLRDLQQAAATLEQGQLFTAANGFAFTSASPAKDYADNGYMRALSADIAKFNKQVGVWMKDMDKMLFHDDPLINGQVQQSIRDEIAFVQPTFSLPLVLPDGMA